MTKLINFVQRGPKSWKPAFQQRATPPTAFQRVFESQRPEYLYPWGIQAANLKSFEIWRETGEWAAIFGKNVRTPYGLAHERYTWVLRGSRLVEIRQRGLLGINHRQFVRMIHV